MCVGFPKEPQEMVLCSETFMTDNRCFTHLNAPCHFRLLTCTLITATPSIKSQLAQSRSLDVPLHELRWNCLCMWCWHTPVEQQIPCKIAIIVNMIYVRAHAHAHVYRTSPPSRHYATFTWAALLTHTTVHSCSTPTVKHYFHLHTRALSHKHTYTTTYVCTGKKW